MDAEEFFASLFRALLPFLSHRFFSLSPRQSLLSLHIKYLRAVWGQLVYKKGSKANGEKRK